MQSERASAELLHALNVLLGAVKDAALPYETDESQAALQLRDSVADQLSNYILPRVVQVDAPLLVVIGGSTGAGKSTLVNSLIGEHVSDAGVLRPTTRSPVLVHHPDDGKWFESGHLLPELTRAGESAHASHAIRVVSSESTPPGLALLDAPDVDSIDTANRELASQLLRAADLWIFVTSAARYADQVPWEYLRTAAERSTAVAVVLDRVHNEGLVEVRGHLARMMSSRGLSDSPLFTVPESRLDSDGLLPSGAVEHITGWLSELDAATDVRVAVATQTLDGAVRQNVFGSHDVADAMDEQVQAAEFLLTALDSSFSLVSDAAEASLTDGSLVNGQLAERWQEFVGGGEVMRSMEEKVGRIGERLIDGMRGKRTRSAHVFESIESSVAAVLQGAIESAVETTVKEWSQDAYGHDVVQEYHGRTPQLTAQRVAHDWQQSVIELVRSAVTDKRLNTNVLAIGNNGIAVTAMIAALCANDDRSRPTSRQLLDATLGAAEAAQLTEQALQDLRERARDLMNSERTRFEALLVQPETVRHSQSELREAAKRAEHARHTDFLEAGW